MKKILFLVSVIAIFLVLMIYGAYAASPLPVNPYQGGTAVSSSAPLNVKLGDGTNTASVTPASTAPTAAQKALVVAVSPNGDPCQNPNIAKSSAIINVGAATTGELVALSSGKTIYVCGFLASLAGTTPTVKFVYGTGTACATGQADLTGAYAPTTGSMLHGGWGGTMFQGAASNALCATTTGTGSSFQGRITFVQQ